MLFAPVAPPVPTIAAVVSDARTQPDRVGLELAGLPLRASTATIYVPNGYRLGALPPVGRRVGEEDGTPLVAAPPDSAACAPGRHDAVWSSGRVALAVDRTTGDDGLFASIRLRLCLPAGPVVRLSLRGVVHPPARGSYLWRALLPGRRAVVEGVSLVRLPLRASVLVTRAAGRLRVRGVVAEAGRRVPGLRFEFVRGRARVVRLADADGVARATLQPGRGAVHALVTSPVERPAVAKELCLDELAPGGCVSATYASVDTVTSQTAEG